MSDEIGTMTCRRSVDVGVKTMPGPLPNGLVARFGQYIRRLHEDVSGVAAVEFGFIAPIMLLFLLGTIEVTRAVAIDQRFTQATNMVADLVAREDKLSAADVNAIYGIAGEVMRPYDVAALKISIIPVMSNPNNAGDTRVYPTAASRPSFNGGAQPAQCQAYSLSKGVLDKNESVVVIEASYKFQPMFVGYLMSTTDWTYKSFAKPRKGNCVNFDSANCISSCFS